MLYPDASIDQLAGESEYILVCTYLHISEAAGIGIKSRHCRQCIVFGLSKFQIFETDPANVLNGSRIVMIDINVRLIHSSLFVVVDDNSPNVVINNILADFLAVKT